MGPYRYSFTEISADEMERLDKTIANNSRAVNIMSARLVFVFSLFIREPVLKCRLFFTCLFHFRKEQEILIPSLILQFPCFLQLLPRLLLLQIQQAGSSVLR